MENVNQKISKDFANFIETLTGESKAVKVYRVHFKCLCLRHFGIAEKIEEKYAGILPDRETLDGVRALAKDGSLIL